MKILTDALSICMLSKSLQKFSKSIIKDIFFFPSGLSFITDSGLINIILHARFSWIFSSCNILTNTKRATGWIEVLKNSTIDNILQYNNDRIIYFNVSVEQFASVEKWYIWIELIGGFPNIFLTKGSNYKIVRFFRKSRSKTRTLSVGSNYQPLKYKLNETTSLNKDNTIDTLKFKNITESNNFSSENVIKIEVKPDIYHIFPYFNQEKFTKIDPLTILKEITDIDREKEPDDKEIALNKIEKKIEIFKRNKNTMLNLEELKNIGEKIKILPENHWDSIKSENPKLEYFIRRLKKLKKGTAIKKIFSLYRKLINQNLIYDEMIKKNLKLKKKILKGDKETIENYLKISEKDNKTGKKFRIFQSPSGRKIYISKKKEDAYDLTFKIAKPNDYFFHTKDAPGAHTVLILDEKKDPPIGDIEITAQLAALFSSQKNSSVVPVQYTKRKYVRKPRKSPQGFVVLEREKVIFVKPMNSDDLIRYKI